MFNKADQDEFDLLETKLRRVINTVFKDCEKCDVLLKYHVTYSTKDSLISIQKNSNDTIYFYETKLIK